MCSLKTTILFTIFSVHVSAHVSYLLLSQTPQEKAEQFDKTAIALCTGQPLTCIEPLLHKDFTFVTKDAVFNRTQYVEFLKKQDKKKNDFTLDTVNAKQVGDQVDVPVLHNGTLHLHLFLVDDASVQGAISLIKIDKKNL